MIAGISNAKSTATPQKNDLKSILTIFMMTVYSAPRTMNICNFGKSLPCLVPHFTERLKARARFNPHRYCFVGNGNELSEFFVIEISPSMLNNTKYEICAEILIHICFLDEIHRNNFVVFSQWQQIFVRANDAAFTDIYTLIAIRHRFKMLYIFDIW